jgi:hypothetical protein
MVVLEIALDAFGTELSLVHGKILPRLEAHHMIVFDLELNAALHTAETAVSFDQPIGWRIRLAADRHRFGMRTVARNQNFFGYW